MGQTVLPLCSGYLKSPLRYCVKILELLTSAFSISFALAPYDTVYTNMWGRCRNRSKMWTNHKLTIVNLQQPLHLHLPPTILYTQICEEDAETLVKCELTIDNSEAVQQCLAIKPVVVFCVSNFKHPRTIAEQPARQPGRNTAWAGERSCYLSRGH